MTSPEPAALRDLAARIAGGVACPGDDDYEVGRKVWNARIDRHPVAIARCAGVQDVLHSIEFARRHEIGISVRGAGHHASGSAVSSGTLVVDLRALKGIRVDPDARRVRAQAGVVWAELDRETQSFGLATTGGCVSRIGISGLTLGGGYGWLMRKYGLSCDNLTSVDMVTADGRFIVADAERNEELFWSSRGGGGNFGVVTSFEYRLHPVGPLVAGMVAYPLERAREVLRAYRDWCADAPDELTAFSILRRTPEGDPILVVVVCHCGPTAEGERAVRALRQFATPIKDTVAVVPYSTVQTMFEPKDRPAPITNRYWKAHFLTKLDDDVFETLIAHFERAPSPRTTVFLEQLGGATARVASAASAYPHRAESFSFLINCDWLDPADADRNMEWTRGYLADMNRFASGGVYVNYLSDDDAGRAHAAFGVNHARLSMLKAKYDPTNVVRSATRLA